MHIARVIGTVVSSQKEQELVGIKFLLLQHTDPAAKPKDGTFVVAADAVGAGVGDLVLYCSGSSARQTLVTKDRPVDATVMAIVDMIAEQEDFVYRKDAE